MPRLTYSLVRLLSALDDDPGGRHYGYALSVKGKLNRATAYGLLTRLADRGWLTYAWEGADPGHPPRRYYTVTETGAPAIAELLEQARRDARFRDELAA
jgi:PadR family transcriptional regulator PadR